MHTLYNVCYIAQTVANTQHGNAKIALPNLIERGVQMHSEIVEDEYLTTFYIFPNKDLRRFFNKETMSCTPIGRVNFFISGEFTLEWLFEKERPAEESALNVLQVVDTYYDTRMGKITYSDFATVIRMYKAVARRYKDTTAGAEAAFTAEGYQAFYDKSREEHSDLGLDDVVPMEHPYPCNTAQRIVGGCAES